MVSDCGGTYWAFGRPTDAHWAVRRIPCKVCGHLKYEAYDQCEVCIIKLLLSKAEYAVYEKRCKDMLGQQQDLAGGHFHIIWEMFPDGEFYKRWHRRDEHLERHNIHDWTTDGEDEVASEVY